MKKSSPHKNNFTTTGSNIPTYSNITMKDIREAIDQLKAANITRTEIEVTEYDELHYKLSGSAYGIVRKDKWNEALIKASEKK